MSEKGKGTVSAPTVVVSALAATVVSAVIVGIGALGISLIDRTAAGQEPSTVVNLGTQQPYGANPPAAPAAPAALESAPADAPVDLPPALAPAAPAATPDAQPAAPTTASPGAPTTRRSPQSIREAKASDLTVTAERPTKVDLEWQYAAFWNPRIPTAAKMAVVYNGNDPKARKEINQVMASSQTYDFFSMRGAAAGPPRISGNRMSITFRGTMAGFPVMQVNYYYLRDGGQWKLDFKRICASIACNGNPDFGY
ncbi:hypothetical protein C6V83_08670 [Gordonia iterans]|uniref:Low molecular weight antigen MTB12-like C-terminal domain-containing protein n=1 Tax=Gordonia iterans TaxID=1004901 RepID=A0A2S0KF90_9ACTN|nr:hypothetical protein [Gordonia iterans]AVM00334.1 hypothetical protein C6V83_08670 [Gordonia iterans]